MIKRRFKLSDNGSALPAVLMIMVIVMTFAAVGMKLGEQQTKEEIFFENDTGAFHAAEAGMHKYLWHLNKEGSTLAMDTVVPFPQDNPVAAYQLTCISDGSSKKRIQATGWMLNDPSVKKTVEAEFIKISFTEYIYFSDNDPADIWWTSSENCYGPYHTNTKLSSWGRPNFWGKATTVDGIDYYGGIKSGNEPNFRAGYEKLSKKIPMPKNNTELMSYGKAADGYYYEGRTSILLNSNGTITVLNKNTTPNKKTLPLPANGVIYVNERAGANNNQKFNENNGNVFISGKLNGKLTVAAKNDIYITGYDPTEVVFSTAKGKITDGITYKDTTFSLNPATGVVTVNEAAGAAGADMLGLIADRNIVILTKGWLSGGDDIDSSRGNMNVYAAMMAIKGSFINSVFMNGALPEKASPESVGNLIVRGSIVQNTRGIVGYVSHSGYSKDYAHDTRMLYDSPPHYLVPEENGWNISVWQ